MPLSDFRNLYMRRYPLFLKLLAGLVYPATVVLGTIPMQASGQLVFPPTGGRGTVSRTVGGGTRSGACISREKPIALVPPNDLSTIAGGQATLFLYLPKLWAKTAELSVTDASDRDLYAATIAMPKDAGVIQVSLPEKVALQPNQAYYWEFAIVCDPKDRTKDLVIGGVLWRTEVCSDLQTALQQATPLKQAELYANARIWQNALTTAAQLRDSNPAAWEQLLKSVGLEAIARKPFVKKIVLPQLGLESIRTVGQGEGTR
jgi:hypothetical protein